MNVSDRRRDERGYLCVWGTTTKEKVVDREGVEMECPECGETTRLIGKRAVPYCAVFYIPLFPEGKGVEFFECTACGGKFQGSIGRLRKAQAGEKKELEEQIAAKGQQFRANPDDLETACELIELCMAAEREEQALGLAQTLAEKHPTDANVQVLLGRIYLSKDQKAGAITIFDRALAAAPQHPGAHFFKAVALLSEPAPNLPAALEEAKLAHQCGYPDARDLARNLTAALEEEE